MTPRQLEEGDFPNLMAELPAGVCVVTVADRGRPMGLVVTSMTAYTAEPPSVMCSIGHSSRAHAHVTAAESFGAHLLGIDQEHVARAFASKADDKFAGLEWSWDRDVPRIHGVVAYGRLALETTFSYWDHTVVIGRVEEVEYEGIGAPMVYLRRKFAWRLTD